MSKISIIFDRLRTEEKMLQKEATELGHTAIMLDAKITQINTDTKKEDLDLGDVALERCVSYFRGLHFTSALEFLDIPVLNKFDVANICGNKMFMTLLLKKNNIPTPKTYFSFSSESATENLEKVGYPLVIKPVIGSWGRGVIPIKDKDAMDAIVEVRDITDSPHDRIYYLQEVVKRPPRDIRIITVGDKPIAGMYRKSSGGFKTNIARHFSKYHEGSFTMDDMELANQNIHRLGNVLVPMDSYGPLIEKKMTAFLEEEYQNGVREMTTAEICKMIGKHLGEDSFLYWAYKNDISIVVPGIMDGAVGSQIWMFSQSHRDFKLNLIGDADLLSGLIFKAEKSGAFMIGGGISKHHTLWWNQYREGLDYAFYITTAQEFDGSLSGALVREAISWGKVTQIAKQSTLHAEVTTILPFIYSALLSKLNTKS